MNKDGDKDGQPVVEMGGQPEKVSDVDAAQVAEPPVEVIPETEAPAPADDRLLRLQADFDNFRKRMLREKADLYRRANEDIMEELLPVLDHLVLAQAAADETAKDDPVAAGFKLVGEQLRGVLARFGLSAVAAEPGDPFDPNLHEAIMQMPSDEVPAHAILTRTRAGYMLGERLLRAAQVVVSSGPETGVQAGEEA